MRYNEQLRIGGRNVDDNVRPYPEDKYNEIVQHIERTGILEEDVGNDPQTVTVLFRRPSRKKLEIHISDFFPELAIKIKNITF